MYTASQTQLIARTTSPLRAICSIELSVVAKRQRRLSKESAHLLSSSMRRKCSPLMPRWLRRGNQRVDR